MIEYKVSTEFGRLRMYILDKDKAVAVKKLTGRVTLSDEMIDAFKILGVICKEKK